MKNVNQLKTRPLNVSIAIEKAYAKSLEKLTREMFLSVRRAIVKTYKRQESQIVFDASPVSILKRAMGILVDSWTEEFDTVGQKIVARFTGGISKYTDRTFNNILKESGFTVKSYIPKQEKVVLEAIIQENVELIKSIPQKFFTEVQGLVMRSITQGRDLSSLQKDLVKRYGITTRRARNIALDQTNKAVQSLADARALDRNITDAIWIHTPGSREPRKTHVAMNGKQYKIKDGLYDSHVGRKVKPGEEVNCLLGSTPITDTPYICSLFKSWYVGDIIDIYTKCGKELSLTNNHKMLFNNEWNRVDALKEGMHTYLANRVYVSTKISSGSSLAIEEIYTFFEYVLNGYIDPGNELFLYKHCHTDLEIVSVSNALLHNELENVRQVFYEHKLPYIDLYELGALVTGRLINNSLFKFFADDQNAITRVIEDCKLFIKTLNPLQFLVFLQYVEKCNQPTRGNYLNVLSFYIKSDPYFDQFLKCVLLGLDYGSAFKDFSYLELPMVINDLNDLGRRKSMFYSPVEVDRIEVKPYEGYVYNLETSLGYYVGNNILIKNCHCKKRYVIPDLQQR